MNIPNTETLIDIIWENIAKYILGSDVLVGLWVWLILFGFATIMRLEFSVALILLIPATIVFMAFASIPTSVGVVIMILAGIILAFSFWQNR